MSLPILFIQCADDDAMIATSMNEFPIFQVDAYVGGMFLLSSVMEETLA